MTSENAAVAAATEQAETGALPQRGLWSRPNTPSLGRAPYSRLVRRLMRRPLRGAFRD